MADHPEDPPAPRQTRCHRRSRLAGAPASRRAPRAAPADRCPAAARRDRRRRGASSSRSSCRCSLSISGRRSRTRAESEGSKFIERPMHIGRLSAKLTPGVVRRREPDHRRADAAGPSVPHRQDDHRRSPVVDDLQQEADHRVGRDDRLEHGDRDLRRTAATTSRSSPARRRAQGPSRFTTTLRSVVALRGAFTYEDHGTPWSTVGAQPGRPGLPSAGRHELHRAAPPSRTAPSRSSRTSRSARTCSRGSRIDNGIVHFDHMDLSGDGSRRPSSATWIWPLAGADLSRSHSKIDFATQKNIFFHGQTFTASGHGDFAGTFHLFKGGRELKGTFTSPLAGVNAWRFPNLRGSVLWVPDRLEITNTTARASTAARRRFDYRMAPFGNPAGADAGDVGRVDYRDVDLARLSDFLETKGLRLTGSATGTQPSRVAARASGPRRRGGGEVTIQAPAGVRTMTRELQTDVIARVGRPAGRRGPVQLAPLARLPAGRRATSSTRSIPSGSPSTTAGPRPRAPTCSSRAGRRSARTRGSRSTSRASTGRRAIACWPGS